MRQYFWGFGIILLIIFFAFTPPCLYLLWRMLPTMHLILHPAAPDMFVTLWTRMIGRFRIGLLVKLNKSEWSPQKTNLV